MPSRRESEDRKVLCPSRSSTWILNILPGCLSLAFISLCLTACSPVRSGHSLSGFTMGTTYSIRIAGAPLSTDELQNLQEAVDAELEEVNRQMSTYRPDSEISFFNRAGADQPVPISPEFQAVVRRSITLAEATGGTFDPTVGILINLWGFGPDEHTRRRPSETSIEEARRETGIQHLSLTPDGMLSKDIPGLILDLGAIAKGYGVDRVAGLLREKGLTRFLVEIGGETLGEGRKADGSPWLVGVLRPDLAPGNASPLQGIVQLTGGRAIATSGDYRNFYRDENGTLQTHIIDPRTAAPVQHAAASVSVLAGDCATADALATALLILGPEEGLPLLASEFPGVEALFILRHGEHDFEEIATPGFANALSYRH